jgi:cytochrome P450
MLLTITLFTCVICLIIVYIWIFNNRYDYFKRHGIPGPPHRFFFGHYKVLWSAKSFSKQLQQWTREYGSIYGLFAGTQPMYIVSDVDFLQEVYIKQFSSFHSRRLPIVLRLQTGHKVHLFGASGARWRRQRHVISPTFSSAKLKLMLPLVNGSIGAMLNKLSELVYNKNTEINIYTLYKRMTMDVICK